MSGELLPCPFCGADARCWHDTSSDYARNWSWMVECGGCNASMEGYRVESDVIAAWNRRIPSPDSEVGPSSTQEGE